MNSFKSLVIAAVLACFGATVQAANLVVIGHPSADTLTQEQVADLYLGRRHTATLYDYPENSAQYARFYQQATGRDTSQIKSMWSRIVFSGRGQAPRQLPDAAAVKQAVADDPRAIGYIEQSLVDSSVKVFFELN